MAIRFSSASSSSPVPLDGFAICNSRGRRVSLLNDEDDSFTLTFAPAPSSPHECPLSPTDTSDSEHIEASLDSQSYSNPSATINRPLPHSFSPHFPPVNDLISFSVPDYDNVDRRTSPRKSSLSPISGYSPRSSLASTSSRRSSGQSSQSRGTKRRYECGTCGKSFTTSGHVARHNRIHTGEKNFQCPEPGCSQRFSRQDNCMQHYRTHKNHAQFSVRPPPSSICHRSKRKRTEEDAPRNVPVDPNDRLSALATYISVYA